jgi:ketosteroid isomerase-like protein
VLQQHVVHVVMKDGAGFKVDAAVYFRFDDGLITRIEEYASLPGHG